MTQICSTDRRTEFDEDSILGAYITNYFQSQSDIYRNWIDIRIKGENNDTIQTFFDRKEKGDCGSIFENEKQLLDHNYLQEQFKKFYLQIRDIDFDLSITTEIGKRCTALKRSECFTFLEFGCAPGGIAAFILDINWRIRGAGVTLPTYLGGYGISQQLQNETRFHTSYTDLVDEAKHDRNLSTRFSNIQFSEFDLIINGITIHKRTHYFQRLEISLTELYYSLPLLRDGGMLLVVLNANLSFSTLQYFYILFNLFDNCKATKPLAVYPIRKCFWMLCTGFRKQRLQNWNLVEVLREILTTAKDISIGELEKYYRDIYFLGNIFRHVPGLTFKLEITKMLSVKWCSQIIKLMNPVWDRQRGCIEQVLEGKKWLICQTVFNGNRCTRRQCTKAHSEEELISTVKDRLIKLYKLQKS